MHTLTAVKYLPSAWMALVCALSLGGCMPNALYDWGHYEDSLYLRYSQHDFAKAEAYLQQSVPTAGAQAGRVPPGLFADYGFLLYRRGDHTGAVAYFEKEKAAFPESTALMNKLIERIHQKSAADSKPAAANGDNSQ